MLQFILYGLRKKAGLSQADMAKKLEISEASYRQKELERSEFKLTEMFKIADILDKDISDIFTKTTSRKVNNNQPN
ncbi:helix-turn-helix transcriptional regulator [Streptococcus parasuis]|uniref:helix-turn-helix transcriptional regulator n=1 Tax=Streptococcus parasuis TaxID=1501662 RepID=UPI00370DB0B0